MREENRRPWDKRDAGKEKKNVDQSKRDFLGASGAAIAGAGIFASGAAFERGRRPPDVVSESAQDTYAPASPMFLQSQEAREALERGDLESMETAEEIIRALFNRLDGEMKYCKERQNKLDVIVHLPQPNYAQRALLVNEIQFSTQMQDSLLAAIKELQEPMRSHSENSKPESETLPKDKKRRTTA